MSNSSRFPKLSWERYPKFGATSISTGTAKSSLWSRRPAAWSRSSIKTGRTPLLGCNEGPVAPPRAFLHVQGFAVLVSFTRVLADGVGFEPTRPLRACRFSRPVPSTARPPIHVIRSATYAASLLQPDSTWHRIGTARVLEHSYSVRT